jgi:uncharacterized protein YciW
MSRMTEQEFEAEKAAQRAELIRGMLGEFEERRAQLERRQAHIENELERLRALQLSSGGSVSITDQIAELEGEWRTCRQIEARLEEEHGVAKKAVANLRD